MALRPRAPATVGAGLTLGAVRRMASAEDDTLRRSVESRAAENARLRNELAAALAAEQLPARRARLRRRRSARIRTSGE